MGSRVQGGRVADGDVEFTGPYIQGGPGRRFIYLRGVWSRTTAPSRCSAGPSSCSTPCRPDVARQAVDTGVLVGALGLTDDKGNPLCAGVRPSAIEWSAGILRTGRVRRRVSLVSLARPDAASPAGDRDTGLARIGPEAQVGVRLTSIELPVPSSPSRSSAARARSGFSGTHWGRITTPSAPWRRSRRRPWPRPAYAAARVRDVHRRRRRPDLPRGRNDLTGQQCPGVPHRSVRSGHRTSPRSCRRSSSATSAARSPTWASPTATGALWLYGYSYPAAEPTVVRISPDQRGRREHDQLRAAGSAGSSPRWRPTMPAPGSAAARAGRRAWSGCGRALRRARRPMPARPPRTARCCGSRRWAVASGPASPSMARAKAPSKITVTTAPRRPASRRHAWRSTSPAESTSDVPTGGDRPAARGSGASRRAHPAAGPMQLCRSTRRRAGCDGAISLAHAPNACDAGAGAAHSRRPRPRRVRLGARRVPRRSVSPLPRCHLTRGRAPDRPTRPAALDACRRRRASSTWRALMKPCSTAWPTKVEQVVEERRAR